MLNRLAQTSVPVTTQITEMAAAVPQVIAHRMIRMAFSGVLPSTRDRQEFELMSVEKSDAFMESWSAMTLQSLKVGQELAVSFMAAFWSPWALNTRSTGAALVDLSAAALEIMHKGMEPLHTRAVANAERLSLIKH